MVLLWLTYQISTYGIFALVLKKSDSVKSDFWWMMALSVPIAFLDFIWLMSWRLGIRAEFPSYTSLTIAIAVSVTASSASMYIYFRETPSWANVVGIILAFAGAFVATFWGER